MGKKPQATGRYKRLKQMAAEDAANGTGVLRPGPLVSRRTRAIIRALANLDNTYEAIAKRYHVKRQWVGQVARRNGLGRKQGRRRVDGTRPTG